MINQAARLAILVSAFIGSACTTDPATTTSATHAIIDTSCTADVDCPTGFQCEVEVEQGTTTSFCQAEEDSHGACPAGYEVEVEHGQTYCRPDDAGAGSGSGVIGAACATTADCAAGLECETELEHGQTTSTCKVHGGR